MSVFYNYLCINILFHLQMKPILYFAYSTVSVTMSTIQNSNAYNILLYNSYYIHYYKNVFAHKCFHYASSATSTFSFQVRRIQMRMRN